MPTRKSGEATAFYIGAAAEHSDEMDIIFTGRTSLDGEAFLYNARLSNPSDMALTQYLEVVEDIKVLMSSEEWEGPDEIL
jgi:hypothetical protein